MADSSCDSVARILALSCDGVTDKVIVSEQNVGGVVAGQTWAENTSLQQIIEDILGTVAKTVKIYIGHSETEPTIGATVTSLGLTEITAAQSSVLDPEGFLYTITCGIAGDPTQTPPVLAKAEYPIIAVPHNATYGDYNLTKWAVYNFPYALEMKYIEDTTNGYIDWYLDGPSYDRPEGVKYRFNLTRNDHT